MSEKVDRHVHWEKVYQTKPLDSVSWYRQHLDVSLELLELSSQSRTSQVIDIGGGASTLVDDLLDRGMTDVTVLDISEAALAVPRARLGAHGTTVTGWSQTSCTPICPRPVSISGMTVRCSIS